ncbi:MAG: STAS domain-containing protein [Candidatus Acidiferrales bacterium]
MAVQIRKAGKTAILDLNGPLMVGESEMEFRQKIQGLLDEGARRIAINLAGVAEMDSWGLGALVRHCTRVKRAGGRCIFFAPTARVLQLLKTAHLDSVLDMAENEADALSRI